MTKQEACIAICDALSLVPLTEENVPILKNAYIGVGAIQQGTAENRTRLIDLIEEQVTRISDRDPLIGG